jgi:hypothetical protein
VGRYRVLHLEPVRRALALAGATPGDAVKLNFTRQTAVRFTTLNPFAREAFFEALSTQTLVEVSRLAMRGFLVELEVTAVVPVLGSNRHAAVRHRFDNGSKRESPIILIIWGDVILVRRLDGVGHLWNWNSRLATAISSWRRRSARPTSNINLAS